MYSNPPHNMTQAQDIVDQALALAMHAMHTTVAPSLGSTPGALAFSRDMFLNIPLVANWQAIAMRCEHHVNENLCQANRKQHQYDYAPGQQVMKKVHNPTTLGVRTTGLYTIDCVHVNGNFSISCIPVSPIASTYEESFCIGDILPHSPVNVHHWHWCTSSFFSFFTSPLHIN
jgi:hypothetical protein